MSCLPPGWSRRPEPRQSAAEKARLCYIPEMSRRLAAAVLGIAFLPACGKKVEDPIVTPIRTFAGADLKADQIQIDELRESGDQAIAEITVKTAVRMKKENGQWVIDEIRLGDRHWEKAENILAAIQTRRTQRTSGQLNQIAGGIRGYQADRGSLPQAEDFEALIDMLAPRFLQQVVRLDAWSRPFRYRLLAGGGYDLRSSGPDGYFDTEDDLVSEKADVQR